MNGACLLVEALKRQQVEVVFGYPGGAIMPLYDALLDAPFPHILVRHEQAAALAADGWARVTGRPGVCLATSGPGATNLVTGIANAYMDSVPMVIITGQVPSSVMGTDAFQEVDVLGVTMPIVKHGFLVKTVEEIPERIAEAFEIAGSGRPGPVILDIPKDVMMAAVDTPVHWDQHTPRKRTPKPPEEAELERARDLLVRAKRPLVYAGGGIALAQAVSAFRTFLRQTGLPSVATLKGLGSVDPDDPNYLGMLGMHGLRAANLAVQTCDLLVVVGARLDDRATGKLASFAPEAAVIHLDIDAAEIGKLRTPQAAIQGDLTTALERLTMPMSVEPWLQACAELKLEHAWPYSAPGTGIYGPRLIKQLTQQLKPDDVVTCDVGQHQMWVAQHGSFHHPSNHLSSGGLGTMGYGLPAAIGAQFAKPEATVVAVSGDGSVMMNIQELATIQRYALPVKILLLDNQSLGLVRQWQELFFKERFSSVDLSDNPDFTEVAKAFGIPAKRFIHAHEEEACVRALCDTPGPLLAHVLIDPRANVWPLVPPGKSNADMMEGAHR